MTSQPDVTVIARLYTSGHRAAGLPVSYVHCLHVRVTPCPLTHPLTHSVTSSLSVLAGASDCSDVQCQCVQSSPAAACLDVAVPTAESVMTEFILVSPHSCDDDSAG